MKFSSNACERFSEVHLGHMTHVLLNLGLLNQRIMLIIENVWSSLLILRSLWRVHVKFWFLFSCADLALIFVSLLLRSVNGRKKRRGEFPSQPNPPKSLGKKAQRDLNSQVWDLSFPLENTKSPQPETPGKFTQNLQFGPPRDRPENYRKMTIKID